MINTECWQIVKTQENRKLKESTFTHHILETRFTPAISSFMISPPFRNAFNFRKHISFQTVEVRTQA